MVPGVDTLTATYDSRNRLVTRVVPGVGTITHTYAGPLDQLTRLWVSGAVDSIGNVTGPDAMCAFAGTAFSSG